MHGRLEKEDVVMAGSERGGAIVVGVRLRVVPGHLIRTATVSLGEAVLVSAAPLPKQGKRVCRFRKSLSWSAGGKPGGITMKAICPRHVKGRQTVILSPRCLARMPRSLAK